MEVRCLRRGRRFSPCHRCVRPSRCVICAGRAASRLPAVAAPVAAPLGGFGRIVDARRGCPMKTVAPRSGKDDCGQPYPGLVRPRSPSCEQLRDVLCLWRIAQSNFLEISAILRHVNPVRLAADRQPARGRGMGDPGKRRCIGRGYRSSTARRARAAARPGRAAAAIFACHEIPASVLPVARLAKRFRQVTGRENILCRRTDRAQIERACRRPIGLYLASQCRFPFMPAR